MRPCPQRHVHDTQEETSGNKDTSEQHGYAQNDSFQPRAAELSSTDLYHHGRHHAIEGPAKRNRQSEKQTQALHPWPAETSVPEVQVSKSG